MVRMINGSAHCACKHCGWTTDKDAHTSGGHPVWKKAKNSGTAYTIKPGLLQQIEQFKLVVAPRDEQTPDQRKKIANTFLPTLESLRAMEKEMACPDEAKMVGLLLRLLLK